MDNKDLSILTQVVFKQLFTEPFQTALGTEKAWEMLKFNTLKLAQTIEEVQKEYKNKLNEDPYGPRQI